MLEQIADDTRKAAYLPSAQFAELKPTPKTGDLKAGATQCKIRVPTCWVIRRNYSLSHTTLGLISLCASGEQGHRELAGIARGWEGRRSPELGMFSNSGDLFFFFFTGQKQTLPCVQRSQMGPEMRQGTARAVEEWQPHSG